MLFSHSYKIAAPRDEPRALPIPSGGVGHTNLEETIHCD